MSQELVTLTIDGRTVQVPKGTNLVEAAKQAGIEIPVFCYHPKLDPAGICRMCLVQMEGARKPVAACVTTVGDGMVVHTQNEQVGDLRRGVLEFLLLNHPLDCPVCDKGGECDLQDLTFEYGPTTSRLQDAKIQKNKSVDLGNFIVLDNERCILCRRCVRFDDEVATEGNLIVEERGHFNTVTTMEGQRYDSYFSGNTIELCPVGALTSELYRFKARPWDLAKVDSVCTGCSVGCNTRQEFRHGQLLRITSRENEAIDNSWLCDRGRFNYKYVQADNRVTQPLVRKDGRLVPVKWAEALELVASKLKDAKLSTKGEGVGVIGGGKLTNEEAYLLQKFARETLGTRNVDHRVSGQAVASLRDFPGRQTDLSDASAILIVDTDPAETAPVMDLRIRRMADRKQAKIAVVGSVMPTYRGRHARIQLKPGQVADVIASLAAAVSGQKPLASAADPEAVVQLAKLLTMGSKVAIVWGGYGAAVGKAIVDLGRALQKAARGDEPGRSVHVLIPGAQHNSRGAEAMGVLPGDGGRCTGEMLMGAAEGKIKALYVAGANLMNTIPNRKLVEKAFANSFVVVADMFLNETAAAADVVLPVAALSEKSGTYTTLDGVVQAVKVAKAPEGSAQPDGDILVAIAKAMGSQLAKSPADTSAEIAKKVTKLEPGTVLRGAPASLLKVEQGAAKIPEGLLLVPVQRLYAGGSTAAMDEAFNHVQPQPEALLNPADAAHLGLQDGEQVEVSANGASLQLTVKIDRNVVAGTVQAIQGLPQAPVNALTAGLAPVAVTVAKLAVEVAKS